MPDDRFDRTVVTRDGVWTLRRTSHGISMICGVVLTRLSVEEAKAFRDALTQLLSLKAPAN